MDVNIAEEQLVSKLKNGCRISFTVLYQKYSSDCYRLAKKYLYQTDAAEDVVQNLFLKIWEHRRDIDPSRPFNRYLFTILKNDLLNILHKKYLEIFKIADSLPTYYEYANQKTELPYDAEQVYLIFQAIEQLPSRKKQIMKMKLTGLYSNEEIAQELNLSVNTVKFQYSQVIRECKELLNLNTVPKN